MYFIRNALFKKEGNENGEKEFLERRLLSNGLIQYIEVEDEMLQELTDIGIK